MVPLVLLGLDSNEQREAQYKGYRTDTMVVCAIDLTDSRVVAITIPRDTKADMNILNSKGEVVDTTTFRINSAFNYGCGRKKAAYANCLSAIENLFADSGAEVALSHYIGIDMDAIGPLTDAVGGVPVTLEVDIPGVGQAGETVTLHSETASTYVRTRKGAGMSGSDIERTGRQQVYFKSLAAQIQRMGKASLPGLCAQLLPYVDTDLSLEQLVALAAVLDKVEPSAIEFHTPTGDYAKENGSYMFLAHPDSLAGLAKLAFD